LGGNKLTKHFETAKVVLPAAKVVLPPANLTKKTKTPRKKMQHPKFLTTTSLEFGFQTPKHSRRGWELRDYCPRIHDYCQEVFNSEFSGLLGSIGVTTARKMQFLKRESSWWIFQPAIL